MGEKTIDTMVMENVFGEIKVEERKVDDELRKYGFYIDSFYVTGMTLEEYHRWTRKLSKGYIWRDYLFIQ